MSATLRKHVDYDDRQPFNLDSITKREGTLGGNPRVSTINESGLYSLILGSKMPKAMEFKRWVVSVVLPAILKGRYLHQSGGEVVPGGLDEP